MTSYEKIRIIRQLNKQTQTEFGNALGLSKASISNFETGRVPVPKYLQILLKLLYNIDPVWLMDDAQDDLSERFYEENNEADNSSLTEITKKYSNLSKPKQVFVMNCLDHLLEMQEENA